MAASSEERARINTPRLATSPQRPASEASKTSRDQKWILIPVSVPGCGQEPVTKALESTLGFARARTDSITYRNAEGEPVLSSDLSDAIVSLFKENTIVIVDRDNHRADERQAIRKLCSRLELNANILVIAWELSGLTTAKVANICWNRLRTGVCGDYPRANVSFASIRRVIREYEAPGPDEADALIVLHLDEDLTATLRRIVIGITETLRIHVPPLSTVLPPMLSQLAVPRPVAHFPVSQISSSSLVLRKARRNSPRAAPVSEVPDTVQLLRPHVLSSLHEWTVIVHSLLDLAQRPGHRVTFRSWTSPTGSVITCWKSQRHALFEDPCRLPTLARGLWTENITSPKTLRFSHISDAHRIVARGYDKVFTMDETPWATWSSLRQYTAPPFYITAKITGCLIMFSALSPDSLLVTTKYSFGDGSHVTAGERWLDMQLERLNKTRRQLAEQLWHQQWTLMCELCDESLEQYVFPIPYEQLGLNLHGINKCTILFDTENPDVVEAFAREWGFNPVYYVTANSHKILEAIVVASESPLNRRYDFGSEGLVIRARINDAADVPYGKYRGLPRPPPRSVGTLFIKVSFNKHLLRRALYDMTKNAISMTVTETHRPAAEVFGQQEYRVYPSWIERRVLTDPSQFRYHWQIISSLEEYTQWTQTDEGQAALSDSMKTDMILDLPPPRYKFKFNSSGKRVIFLVGLPGCGKSTVSFALSRIFQWKHVQIRREKSKSAKNARSLFMEFVEDALRCRRIVIADGAFHRAESRERVMKKVDSDEDKAITLQWITTASTTGDAIKICSSRLAQKPSIEATQDERNRSLRRWLTEYDPVRDGEVDAVLPMIYNEDLDATISRAVLGLARLLSLQEPPRHVITDTLNLLKTGVPDMTALDVNESHHVVHGRQPGHLRLFT